MSWMFTKTCVDLNREKKSLKHMKGLRFFKLTEKQTRKQSTTVNIMRIHHDFISIMDA